MSKPTDEQRRIMLEAAIEPLKHERPGLAWYARHHLYKWIGKRLRRGKDASIDAFFETIPEKYRLSDSEALLENDRQKCFEQFSREYELLVQSQSQKVTKKKP